MCIFSLTECLQSEYWKDIKQILNHPLYNTMNERISQDEPISEFKADSMLK